MSFQFFVPGIPKPAGSKQGFIIPAKNGGKARAVLVDASGIAGKHWRAQVQASARAAGAELLDGPLIVRMDFVRQRPKVHFTPKGAVRPSAEVFPTARPDLLKLARAIEDALTGICWRDDAQITLESLAKRFQATPTEPLGVHIWVTRVAPPR